LVIAIDFRVLFGSVKTYTDLCNAYLGRLNETLKIYGFDSSIVTDLQQKSSQQTPQAIFVDLPLAVATKCGFNGVFNLYDEIEYTYPSLQIVVFVLTKYGA